MRLHRCKECGINFETTKVDAHLCPDCAKKSKASTHSRPRTCRTCGAVFMGGPRAWFCPECRHERKLQQSRDHKKRGGPARQLGSIDLCVRCGAEYVVCSGLQKYCPVCADIAVKEVTAPKKREYMAARAEEYNRTRKKKRKDRKVCVVCGKPFSPGTATVTCSEECKKRHRSEQWAMADYLRGKRSSPILKSDPSRNPENKKECQS